VSRLTSDPSDPRLGHGSNDEPVPQNDAYLVLSEEERAMGFVRPLRHTYLHRLELGGCGTTTTMGDAIAETYARNPAFYGATYCVHCQKHRPVGADGEFTWVEEDGFYSDARVGT
jgi:hypothetical protein